MKPMQFRLTEEHVTLIREMSIGWQDSETGAPEVDPKRPYGNSSVERDVAELLGWEIDKHEGLTDEQRDRAMALHRETEVALQVVLQAGTFEPGLYVNRDKHAPYGVKYERAKESRS